MLGQVISDETPLDKKRRKWREANKRYRATENGRLVNRRISYEAKKRDPHKKRARDLINKRILDGTLIRPDSCSTPDATCSGRIEGHHDDYKIPDVVRWLCQKHHGDIHYAR